jgi:hypothetical protein
MHTSTVLIAAAALALTACHPSNTPAPEGTLNGAAAAMSAGSAASLPTGAATVNEGHATAPTAADANAASAAIAAQAASGASAADAR